MHDCFAMGTETAQGTEPSLVLDEIGHPSSRKFRGMALEAEEFARPQRSLPSRPARVKEGSNLGSTHQNRAPFVGDGEALLDPGPDRVLVSTKGGGRFLDRIGEVNLDAPRIERRLAMPYSAAEIMPSPAIGAAPTRFRSARGAADLAPPGVKVDVEASRPMVGAAGVQGDVFGALDPSVGQPAGEDVGQAGERGTVDPPEVY
jgi:hypothetical protein